MSEHIKMPDVAPIVRYRGDGEMVRFVYPFPIFQQQDLRVYIDGALQVSGFTVFDAGSSDGGRVEFDTAPEQGGVVVLQRELPLRRVSDFIQGGGFSAQSLNNELDYITAGLQQVARENHSYLRYSDHEAPASVEMPSRSARAGQALGFDGEGNPIAVPLSAPSTGNGGVYQSPKTGGIERSSVSKMGDVASVRDFGAIGDGLTDDTVAIQQALAAYGNVYVPEGVYLISQTLAFESGQSLYGAGAASQIKCASDTLVAIQIGGRGNALRDLAIEGGGIGVKLIGDAASCTENSLSNLVISDMAEAGLLLDGGDDGDKPCQRNSFSDIVINAPHKDGVRMTLSGGGAKPSENSFTAVRVSSGGQGLSGSGFYIEHAGAGNHFVNCAAELHENASQPCFRVGFGAQGVSLVNLTCESAATVANVRLDSGSSDTSVMNLTALARGGAIDDASGGAYSAVNAGYPEKNMLGKTYARDFEAEIARFGTEFVDQAGDYTLTLASSVYLVSSWNGALTLTVPRASGDNNGQMVVIKKVDSRENVIRIVEAEGGRGIDRSIVLLGRKDDYVTIVSNGAEWYVVSTNRIAPTNRYMDTKGTVQVDMAVNSYFLSSFNGALTMELPPANAPEAINRGVSFKKIDGSGNPVHITSSSHGGPDRGRQTLSGRYDAITVMSNGAEWFVVNKYDA